MPVLALALARPGFAKAASDPEPGTDREVNGERLAELDHDGFIVLAPLVSPAECDALNATIESLRHRRAGTRRLLQAGAFSDLARRIRESPSISALLPDDAVAAQCTLFAKTPHANWSVGPHQDLSIPVLARVESGACGGWSEKESGLFVQPPDSVLRGLLAVRLQLDDHAADTGPLEVVPGSHRLGRLKGEDVLRCASGTRVRCVPERGGAVVLRPLVVHASTKAVSTHPRRVLHFLFGPPSLPFGLRWAERV